MKVKSLILAFFLAVSVHPASAQVTEIISIIKAAVTKAIKAVDLEVQRLQTQTIWLQNIQKQVENTMSKADLNDITGWVQKQRDLYAGYYQELSGVKQVVMDYQKVRDAVRTGQQIILNAKAAWQQFSMDPNLSAGELQYLLNISQGIVQKSAQDLSQLLLALDDLPSVMSDQGRLALIDQANSALQDDARDLAQLSAQQQQISLQRAHSAQEISSIRKLYGLP